MNHSAVQQEKAEIWGGMECTINRVGNMYRDQFEDLGHYEQPQYLQSAISLGFRKIRYPVLWERLCPFEGRAIDWREAEEGLGQLRSAGVTPIVGFLHHGSGPLYTDLMDDKFAVKFARYAKSFIEQFPWVDHFTPINEPLTTARFSGLYGHWYPHHADETSFFRILINQLKGIKLAMKEIRLVNPAAKLVQTEDLGKVHSTASLQYQADFENERRWLTYDLLLGKVNPSHRFWNYLLDRDIEESELLFFVRDPLSIEYLGFNYYITSERFLDDSTCGDDAGMPTGNAFGKYIDTEAVRAGQTHGLKHLLNEAWDRYGQLMAVTECHISCTREEQMRWIMQAWDTVAELNKDGYKIAALTCWALFGAHDWDSLITKTAYHYESGVFRRHGSGFRKTALAKLVRSLAVDGTYSHPLLKGMGWWNTGGAETSEQTLTLIKTSSFPDSTLLESCLKCRNICYEVVDGYWKEIEHPKRDLPVFKSAWAVIILCGEEELEMVGSIAGFAHALNIPVAIITDSLLSAENSKSLFAANPRAFIIAGLEEHGRTGPYSDINSILDNFIDGRTGLLNIHAEMEQKGKKKAVYAHHN